MSFSIKNHRHIPTQLVIVDPVTKEPFIDAESNTVVTFDIISAESSAWDDIKIDVQTRTFDLVRANKTLTPEQHRQLTCELFAAYIAGWNPAASKFLKEELGDSADYSKENAFKLVSNKDYFWLVKQIEVCVNDRSRFFTKQ